MALYIESLLIQGFVWAAHEIRGMHFHDTEEDWCVRLREGHLHTLIPRERCEEIDCGRAIFIQSYKRKRGGGRQEQFT